MNKILKQAAKKYDHAKLAGLALVTSATNALAAPPDYTAITAAVDTSTMLAAIGVLFVAMIGLSLFIAGGYLIWKFVKGSKTA